MKKVGEEWTLGEEASFGGKLQRMLWFLGVFFLFFYFFYFDLGLLDYEIKIMFWESNRVGSHAALMKTALSIFSLLYQIDFEVLD